MQKIHQHRGLIVPVGFVLLMAVILVPMPTWLMDLLIGTNISLAVIILLTTIYMDKPLDFSIFPSLLLATTLLRLVLNIATTRLILSADAPNADAAMSVAGQVIGAFGEFVAGDSLFVGVIIFLILVIVQFMVVTKGAGRVSEVAARFTLDAMPGKQMAIDSDLNAGLITEDEARERRDLIRREADFFGSMDGASKFVRGDAIAGIIITAINILGGFAVGTIEKGWTVGGTANVFTKLTIGDGLTSQIPSFVISIAAALIVTRSGSKDELGHELTDQIISQPKALMLTSVFLVGLALTPLPTIPLITIGFGLAALSIGLTRAERNRARAADEQEAEDAAAASREGPEVDDLLKVDALELEVGYGLVSLVDGPGGGLLERISAIRRQLAAELGFVLPPVRIRDNMQLGPTTYRIKIRGSAVAQGETIPGQLLAMDPGIASGPLEGVQTTEPAFGLEAWWIEPDLRTRAETMNYTVVDPTSVLATHLSEVVKRHAGELLTREEVSSLVEKLKEKTPRLIEETVPAIVKVADLQRILHNLLRERVPIRDLEVVLETLSEWGPRTEDVDVLTEYARHALRRTICQQYAAPDDNGGFRLACITIDPAYEDVISGYIDRGSGTTTLHMPARIAQEVTGRIAAALQQLTSAGHLPVIVASPTVRAVVRQIIEASHPQAAVLGFNEIVTGVELESIALVAPPESASTTAA